MWVWVNQAEGELFEIRRPREGIQGTCLRKYEIVRIGSHGFKFTGHDQRDGERAEIDGEVGLLQFVIL